MRFFLLFVVVFNVNFCNGQIVEPISENKNMEIRYLDLSKNTFLQNEVRKYIKEQSDSCELFRQGFGYITIGGYKHYNLAPIPVNDLDHHLEDIVFQFYIGLSSILIDEFDKSTVYPPFYSIVDGRLVLIYDETIYWLNSNYYSNESKENLTNLIISTLGMALEERFTFKDTFRNSTFTISKEERSKMTNNYILAKAQFTLNASKLVIKLFDGTIKYKGAFGNCR